MLGKHINHCEDSLTAAVFTHLLHLPGELFWQILRDACYTDLLPKSPGEPLTVDFWPNWDAQGTENKNRVVPDLFIQFADFDLIIEAKRWDDGMQNSGQWLRELMAYANEYGAKMRPVKMIALGGIHSWKDDELIHRWSSSSTDQTKTAEAKMHTFVCPVYMCRWRGLLNQCKKMHRELNRLDFVSSQVAAHARVVGHVIDLFGWHGFSTGLWFADFDFSQHRLSTSVTTHLGVFQQRSRQLQRA